MLKKRILFICTHNSARSQMAEGLCNAYYGDNWHAFSAGTEKSSIKPEVYKVMNELNIDISNQTSKTIDIFIDSPFDLVITVCDSAKEACPFFPSSKKTIHAGFEDPSDYPENQKLSKFREVRDQIKRWLDEYLNNY
ncbi:MAG: arsenate reductase ArsC [Candidatus Heimdallarchaeota archaeon]|nr:arsenate reductase ArsC [Candidatus Heimdallarchaeota archaeon]